MLNMIESSKFLAVRDGLFVNGRLSRILLTFKFLIACTIGVELFIREENFVCYFNWIGARKLFSQA